MKLNSSKEALKISLVNFFHLLDHDLLLVWMNNFRHGLRFCSTSCPVVPILLIISVGEYFYITLTQRYFCTNTIYSKADPLSALQMIMYSNPTSLKLRHGIVVKNSRICKGCHFQAVKGLKLPKSITLLF